MMKKNMMLFSLFCVALLAWLAIPLAAQPEDDYEARLCAWQEKARKFAAEEIAPISLERDAILDPFDAFDWEIIKKGSKLGFRTAVVAKVVSVTPRFAMAAEGRGQTTIETAVTVRVQGLCFDQGSSSSTPAP